MGHVGVGWGRSCRVGWGGLCRGGVGQTWLRYLTAPPPVGHYKGKHDYKMHIYHDHKIFFTLQPQNKGLGTSRGQIYVLPMTWGAGGIGGSLSVDMQPYGCFIKKANNITMTVDYIFLSCVKQGTQSSW